MFAAPVTIGDSTVYVAAVVNRDQNNRFYMSEAVDSNGNYVRISENPSDNTKTGVAAQGGITGGPDGLSTGKAADGMPALPGEAATSPDNKTIPQQGQAVNSEKFQADGQEQPDETPPQVQNTPAARAEHPGLVRDEKTDAAGLTHRQERALDVLGKVLGVEVRFADALTDARGQKAQARYADGVITLALDAADPFMATAVHETVHRIRELSEIDYDYLKNFVVDNMNSHNFSDDQSAKARLYGEDADLTEETVADAFGRILGDEATLRQFVRENSTTAQRFFDALNDLLDRVKAALRDETTEARALPSEQREIYSDLEARLETMLALYSGALQSARDSKGMANSEAKHALFSFDKDGRRFVDITTDQSQFDGLSMKEMGNLATKIIKERFKGKVIGLDNRVFVNGRTATEYGFPAKQLAPQEHEAKMRASTELDNLIDAGSNYRTEADGRDGHIHPDMVDDFRYFDTIFKVGDEYYSGVINIMPLSKGLLLKDITKIENITQDIRSSYGMNPKSTFLRDVSTDSIRDDAQKNKSKYSMPDRYDLPSIDRGDTSAAQSTDRPPSFYDMAYAMYTGESDRLYRQLSAQQNARGWPMPPAPEMARNDSGRMNADPLVDREEESAPELPVDYLSILDLGYGPVSASKLRDLLTMGEVETYVEDGKIRFRRAKDTK